MNRVRVECLGFLHIGFHGLHTLYVVYNDIPGHHPDEEGRDVLHARHVYGLVLCSEVEGENVASISFLIAS